MKTKLQALKDTQKKLSAKINCGFDGENINNYLSICRRINEIEGSETKC